MRSALGQLSKRGGIDAVALARAVRYVKIDVGAEFFQIFEQNRGRCDAVDVVVAVDDDLLFFADRAEDSRHGLCHVVQCERILEDAVVLAYDASRGFSDVKIGVLFPAERPDPLRQQPREGGMNAQLIRQFFRFEQVRLRLHYP